MRPIVTDRVVCLSVSLSVSLSVKVASRAEMAEPIEMPFGLRTRVGPRNYVLDEGQQLNIPMGRGNFEGKWRPTVKYRDALP